MTLTASEVSSLAETLTKWEYAEYVFTGLVTLACFGEFIAEFTDWFTGGVEHRKKKLEKASTLVLVGALALELVCLVKTNSLSGKLIGSLSDQSKQAVDSSTKALGDSGKAVEQSGKAKATASEASALAKGAKKEADSFQQDIASAKKQASEAESHLGEAVSMAKAEEAELLKLAKEVEPRILTVAQQRSITSELRKFSGRTVEVITYGLDGEGAALGTQIISVLATAGVNVRDSRASTVVSGGFDFGVHVRGPANEQPFVMEIGKVLSEKGSLQVWLNTQAAPRAAIVGRAGIRGNASISGGGGPASVGPTPPGSPVTIQVGIKPVQVVLAQ